MALSSSSHVSLCDAGIASIADAVTLAAPLSAHPAHKSSRPFTRLTLHGNAIRVIDAAPLAPFSGHLTHLDLSSNRLESMKGVGELRSLVRLNLASNRIRRIEDLGQLARLRWLELQFNKITLLDGLVALHGNAYTLEKLDLRCNPVQDEEELAYLAGLTKLRDLSFASGALQNYSSSRQHAPRPSAVTLVPSFRRIVFRLLPQLRSLDGADESGRRLEEADLNRLSPVYARPPGERGAWDGGEVDSYEKILQELEEGERMLGRKTTREQSRGFGPEPLSSYLPQHAPLYSPMLGNERSYAAPVQEAPRSYMSQHHTFPRRTPHPTTQNAPPGWPGNPSFLPPNPPSNPPPPPFPMPAPDNPPDPRLASLEHQLAELSNTLADRAAGHHSPPGLRAPRSTLGPTAQPPLDRIVVLERRLAGLLDALDPAGRGPSRPASPQTQMRPPRGSQPPVDRLSRLERRVTMLMDAIVSGGRRSRRASGDDSDASAGAGGDGEKPDEDDEARRFAEWKKRKLKEVNRTRRSGILEGTGSGPPGMVERDRDKPKRKEEQSKTTIRQAAPGPRSAPAAEPPGFAAAAPHEEGSSRRTTNRPPPSPKRTTATSSHPPPPRAPLPPPAPPPPDDTPRLLAMLAAEEERIHAMAAELQTLRLERDSAAKRVEELSRVAEEAKQRCITLDGELRTLREEAEGSRAAKARVLELEGRLKDIEGQLSVALEKSRDVEQRLRIENEAREKAERDNLDAKRGLEETKVAIASLEARLRRCEEDRARMAGRILKEREQARIKIAETKKEAEIYRVAVEALQRDVQALRDASATKDADHRKRLDELGSGHTKSLEAALARTTERLEARHRAERDSLAGQLVRSREAYAALEEEYRRTVKESEEKVKESGEALKEAQRVGKEREEQLKIAAQKEKDSSDLVRDLSAIAKEQKAKISDLLEKNQTYVTVYEDKVHALEERLRSAQKQRSDMRDSVRTVGTLQAELGEAKSRLEETLLDRKRLEEELARKTSALEHQRGALEGRFKAFEDEKAALERSKESSEQALRVKNKMLDDQNDTIRKLKQSLEEKVKELQAVTTDASKREDRLEEQLAMESRTVRELRMELEKTEKYVDHLQTLADEYKEERDYLRKEAAELTRKLKERNESIEKIEEEVNKVKAGFKAKESKAVQEKEIEILTKNGVITDLRNSLEASTSRILVVERERDAVYISVRKLEAELQAAIQQREKCEAEMKVLLTEMDKARKKSEEKMAKLRAAMQDV